MSFKSHIRDIPDFPKEGIIFKDITPLLKDAKKFQELIDLFEEQIKNQNVSSIIGIESRGFIFGVALANQMGISFIPARKKGKLPFTTVSSDYDLEYGTDTVEMHTDAIAPGENVVIIDDLLATGGTCSAVVDLVEQLEGNIVKILFFIELSFLEGRKLLNNQNIYSALVY